MVKSGKCKKITGAPSSVHTRKRCPNGQVRDRTVKTGYHCVKKKSAKSKSNSASFHSPFSNSVSTASKSRSLRKPASSSGSFLLPFSNSSRNSEVGYDNYHKSSSGMKYHDNPLFGKRRVKKSRSKGSRKGSASSLSHSKIYGKKTSSGIKYSAVNPLFNPKKK
jgi:hypothetical protein